jgi:hypothetical protein
MRPNAGHRVSGFCAVNNYIFGKTECHVEEIIITVLLTTVKTVDSNDITVLFQESKNIIFTCGDSKKNSWPSPLVIFSVPTRENNVF